MAKKITDLSISDQLRYAIESGKKSRYQISKETGINQGPLSRFVCGHGSMTLTSIEKIAECLDIELVIRKRKRRKP